MLFVDKLINMCGVFDKRIVRGWLAHEEGIETVEQKKA